MKQLLIYLIAVCISVTSFSQNVGIGTKKPLSKLHVAGDLRIDSLASAKDSGIVIHNSLGVLRSIKLTGNAKDVLHGDGTFSAASLAADASWLTNGNAGTNSTVNFIGTTDQQALKFRVANIPSGEIHYNRNNTAFGYSAMHNATGSNNTAIGAGTLEKTTSGYNNTVVGSFSMAVNTSGFFNTTLGMLALGSNTTGSNNIAIGYGASYQNISGYGNIAIGYFSQYTSKYASNNVSIGSGTLYANTTGLYNLAFGVDALYNNISGSYNTATGWRSLYLNTSGSRNTGYGYEALYANTTGASNVAVGSRALRSNTSGYSHVGVGDSALFANTTGFSNTAVGELALTRNTTGDYNAASGSWSLRQNTTGNNNTAHGHMALHSSTTGSGNTATGYQALMVNTSGSNNTAVGNGADVTVGTLTNATALGYNAKVNASNKVRIGNASVTKIEGQVPFTTPSDGRFKFNIREDVAGLAFIMKLRPVSYQFDVSRWDGVEKSSSISNEMKLSYAKAMDMRRTGFIAQEVDRAAMQSNFDFSGINRPEGAEERYSLSYESFVVPLVKGMQEQQVMINKLIEKVSEQEELINVLLDKVEKLEGKSAEKN